MNPTVEYQTHGAGPIATGDFNGDSKPDLAMASGAVFVGSSVDGSAVLTNKGNGQFNTAVGYSAGSQSSHLAVADFNNHNKDDVVISQFGGESVSVLLNNIAAALPCLNVNDVTITETILELSTRTSRSASLGTPATAVITIKPPQLVLLLEELARSESGSRGRRVMVLARSVHRALSCRSAVVQFRARQKHESHRLRYKSSVNTGFAFTHVKFRLPDNLPAGTCNIKITLHGEETNSGDHQDKKLISDLWRSK